MNPITYVVAHTLKVCSCCVRISAALLVASLCGWTTSAAAWSDHTLCTWYALDAQPELAGQQVVAEPLSQFLQIESHTLPAFLDQEENWARTHLPEYAPRPDPLRFHAGTGANLQRAFLLALRVNALMPMPLFRQLRPGASVAAARQLDWHQLTILPDGSGLKNNSFETLAAGEHISAVDVIATAANEPDYGMDLGLWEDNGTEQGRQAGFGPQPFGNPRFIDSAQAPFHMGFYHEAGIVYRSAPFLKHTYPQARIHLYLQLAHFAFAHGHPYWGYRFTGWAMHYAQDLTQPYHTRVLPGVGVMRMLWINVLDLAGMHGAKRDAVNLVANRHTVVESYQLSRMVGAIRSGQRNDALLQALRDARADDGLKGFKMTDLLAPVTLQSSNAADALDGQLERSFPAPYTSNPDTVLSDADELAMVSIAQSWSKTEDVKLAQLVALQLRQFGVVSRSVVRAALNKDANAGSL